MFWQISLHSSGVNFFLSAVSHAKEAGRPMLRTSRTHKAPAATFEAVEPAAEAMTTDMVEGGRTTQYNAKKEIYIAS